MGKKKFKLEYLLLLLILFVAVIVAGNFTGVLQLQSVVGGTLLSVGETTFSSNDPNGFLNGPVFVFTMRQGGLGQYAYGIAKASDIYTSNYSAGKGFKLEMQSLGEKCNYPITTDSSVGDIFHFESEWGIYALACPFGCSDSGLRDVCLSSAYAKGRALVRASKSAGDATFKCIYGIPIAATAGTLRNEGIYDFSSRFTLTIDGESPISKDISRSDVITGKTALLGNTALVFWQGNLTTGEDCPAPTRIRAAYVGGYWKLISEQKLNDYIQYRNTLYNAQLTAYQVDSYVTAANNSVDDTLSGASFSPFVGDNISSFTQGSYKIVLDKSLQFPLFTFYVKASELAFFQPVSRARIDNVIATNFATGNQGTIEVTFTNVGEVGANFEIFANCTAGVGSSGGTIEKYANVGEQKKVFLPITGNCSTSITSVCTVSVSNMLGDIVTRNVTTVCSPQLTCTPRQKVCLQNAIKQCSDDGVSWVVLKECGSLTCGYDNSNNLACIGDEEIECPPGYVPRTSTFLFWETRACVPEVDWYLVLVIGVVIVGGMILVLYMLIRGKGKKKGRRRKR